MKSLTYKSIDIMKLSKDLVNNQPSDAFLLNLVTAIVNGFHPTHISISVPLDTNAAFIAQGNTPSPRTVIAFTQKLCDLIHAAGVGVLFRGTYCNMENIYGFPFLPSGSGGFIPQGTAASAATDGQSTWLGRTYQYITNNPTFFATGDLIAFFPEQTSYVFGGNSFLSTTPSIQSNYISFFTDLKTVCTAALTAASKTGVLTGFSSNNYSEIRSGYLSGSLFTANGMTSVDYYGNYNGDGYTTSQFGADLTTILNSTGQPIFLQEWADIYNSGMNITARMYYIDNFYRMLTGFGNSLLGFNYWGGWGGAPESVLYQDNTGSWHLNARGKLLAAYWQRDSIKGLPIVGSDGII